MGFDYQYYQSKILTGTLPQKQGIMSQEINLFSPGTGLFGFTSFTFTSPNEDPFAPLSTDITTQSAYAAETWTSNSSFFVVNDGIQYFTAPKTGTYRITCKGAAGKNAGTAANIGYGGIVRGDFSLNQGDYIAMLIGHRPPTSLATSRSWQGGAGGTFVATTTGTASGSNTSATPLLVAGGGGHARESVSSANAHLNCDANMSPDGKNGTGRNGGTQGAESPGGGHNQTGGGGSCGWAATSGDAHGDTRNVYIPTGYPGTSGNAASAYLPARGFLYNGSPGRGGIFNTGYDTSYRGSGGFGGGGPGGWGGEGGGGGYSGGGNGNNNGSSYAGGGGSFISSSATNVGTSTGSWSNGSGYYAGHSGLATSSSLTNLGYNTGNGSVTIELV